jgi:hypothetical protein
VVDVTSHYYHFFFCNTKIAFVTGGGDGGEQKRKPKQFNDGVDNMILAQFISNINYNCIDKIEFLHKEQHIIKANI